MMLRQNAIMFLSLAFFCLIFSVASSKDASLHPIVLVHGHLGSHLYYSVDTSIAGSPQSCLPKTNDTLWLKYSNFKDKDHNACWLAAASRHYDNSSRRSHPAPGVTVSPPPFGDLDGVEWLVPPPKRTYDDSYYVYMVEAFVKKGYVRNKSIKSAPYDWRIAPNENEIWFESTKALIEQMYQENGNKSIILIGHSMAGQFTYVFLNSMPVAWRDKYIRSWILLATCFGGLFKYQYAYIGNDDYPANMFPVTRTAIRTHSTVPFLLPRKAAFGDEVLVKASDAEIRAEDYEKFFSMLNFPDAYEQWKDVKDLYDPHDLTPPGANISIYCIAGFGKQTLKGVTYMGPLSRKTPYSPVYGDGDEFVGADALRFCYQFGKKTDKFGIKEFSDVDHFQIVRDSGPVNHVAGIVNSINFDAEHFSNELL